MVRQTALVQVGGRPPNVGVVQGRKKKKGKKQRKQRVQRTLRFSCSQGSRDKICAAICSQVDPFCAQACGAKLFDSNTQPSFAMQFRKISGLTQYATGTGIGGKQVKPSLRECLRSNSGASGTTLTNWTSWASADGYSATDFSSYRVVSYGVHYYTTAAPDSSAGVIGGIAHPDYPPDSVDVAGTLHMSNYRDSAYLGEFTFVGTREGVETQDFVAIDSYGVPGWTTNTTYFQGAAPVNDAQMGYVEIVINCEVLAANSQNWMKAMTPAAPAIDLIHQASANAVANIPPSADGNPETRSKSVRSTVMHEVERMVASIAPYAVDALIALL